LNMSSPVLVVRIPFERPQDGGRNNPIPVNWTPEKESLLWEELSAARTRGSPGVDWQGLSTRLECSLPYLLYKTQARYEEDLRRIHEVKPIVSTATLPRVSNEESRARVPSLTRPLSHTESTTVAHLTGSPRKPERLLPPARLSSHARSPRPPPSHLPRTPGKYDSQSVSSSSGTEQDDTERRKDEQENLSRKLKELGRMMSNDTLGFARRRNSPTSRRKKVQGMLEASSPPVTRFVGGTMPSVPSSGSSSPGQQVSKIPRPAGPSYTPSNPRSESSQGSEASSFSDISDTSISASVLEETVLSRATLETSTQASTLARNTYRTGG